LIEILCAYAVYDEELGYVQGMSHIASAILLVLKDKEDSFCGLYAFMEKKHRRNLLLEDFLKIQSLTKVICEEMAIK